MFEPRRSEAALSAALLAVFSAMFFSSGGSRGGGLALLASSLGLAGAQPGTWGDERLQIKDPHRDRNIVRLILKQAREVSPRRPPSKSPRISQCQ